MVKNARIKTLEEQVKEQDERFAGFSDELKKQVEDRLQELLSEVKSEMNLQISQMFEQQMLQVKDQGLGFAELSQNLKNQVEESLQKLQSELNSRMNLQISQMFENQMLQMKELFTNLNHPNGFSDSNAARSVGENPANWRDKIGRVELTAFSGEKPKERLRKCDKFFTFYQINDPHRVVAAELFLEGRADTWFLGEKATKANWTWADFSESLLRRFSEVWEKDVVEEFKKLHQRTAVGAYREKFEDLRSLMMTKFPGLTESFFISCFISGLKEELKPMVRLLKPVTLDRAIEIAFLQEQNLEILGRIGRI